MKRRPRQRFIEIADWPRMAPKHANRNFPWCRLYHDFLERPEYMALKKSQRADYWHLVMLANRSGNLIPESAEYLSFMLRESEPLDVEALVTAGLVRRSVAGKARAKDRQDATTGEGRLGRGEAKDQGRGDESEKIAEPQKDAAPPRPADPLFSIPLSDRPNQPYQVTPDIEQHYATRFPGVNVREQLKKFAERVGDDPERRPTLSGLDASIHGWLKKAAGFGR